MEFSLIVQFATGHNFLKYHLSNVHNTTDVSCRLCQDARETSWHLLTECPLLLHLRTASFANRHPEGEDITLARLHKFLRDPRLISLLTPPEADGEPGSAAGSPPEHEGATNLRPVVTIADNLPSSPVVDGPSPPSTPIPSSDTLGA